MKAPAAELKSLLTQATKEALSNCYREAYESGNIAQSVQAMHPNKSEGLILYILMFGAAQKVRECIK